jgi:hypothetical protein
MKKTTKLLSLIMAVVMLMSCFSVEAFAAGTNATTTVNDVESTITNLTFSTELFYGAELKDGKYVWEANRDSADHRFSFRLNYSTSGEGEIGENEIVMTVPKSILLDRQNKVADTYEMSIPSREELTTEDI